MDPRVSRLYREVIDDVLERTPDILFGLDEHTSAVVVESLMQRWEQRLAEVNAPAPARRMQPGQNDPAYQRPKVEAGMPPPSQYGMVVKGIKSNPYEVGVKTEIVHKRKRSDSEEATVKKAKVETGTNKNEETEASDVSTDLDELLDVDVDSDFIVDDKNIDNLMLCQYSRVSRVKTRWRCGLKDGIVRFNGKDVLFKEGSSDFNF